MLAVGVVLDRQPGTPLQGRVERVRAELADLHGFERYRSKHAFELGAAYRNRTDDLRITRGPVACSRGLTCTDSTMDRT
jgi:hypothetical protein